MPAKNHSLAPRAKFHLTRQHVIPQARQWDDLFDAQGKTACGVCESLSTPAHPGESAPGIAGGFFRTSIPSRCEGLQIQLTLPLFAFDKIATGCPFSGYPWCEIAPCLWLTPRARFPEIEKMYAHGLDSWADPYGQAVFKYPGRRPVASAAGLVAAASTGSPQTGNPWLSY